MHETTGGRDFHRRGGSVEIYAFGQDRTAGIAVHTRPRVLRCGVLGERKRATRSAVLYGEGRHGRDAQARVGFYFSMTHRVVTCDVS